MIWPHAVEAYPSLKAEAEQIRGDLLDAELVRYDANMGIDYGRDCIQTPDIGDRCGKEGIKNAEARERERLQARTADMIEQVLELIYEDVEQMPPGVVQDAALVFVGQMQWEDAARLSGRPEHTLKRAWRRYGRQ